MKRTGLRRKGGLRRHSPVPRVSARLKDLSPYHQEMHDLVIDRAGDMCEICETYCNNKRLQWCHLFGRKKRVTEPLTSSPLATLGGHLRCHNDLDSYRMKERQAQLQWRAVALTLRTLDWPAPFRIEDPSWTATRAMEWCAERVADTEGWTWQRAGTVAGTDASGCSGTST